MYRPISQSTVNPHTGIGCYVSRDSVEARPTVNRESVEYRLRASRVSTDMLATLGRCSLLVDSWPTVGQYFANVSSTYHQHLANITADTSVDMSVHTLVKWRSSIG